jgi:hypothetical protein
LRSSLIIVAGQYPYGAYRFGIAGCQQQAKVVLLVNSQRAALQPRFTPSESILKKNGK